MAPKPPRLVPPPKEETTTPGTPYALANIVRAEFERFERKIPELVAVSLAESEGRIAAAVVNKLSGRLVAFENKQKDLEISKGELRNEVRRQEGRISSLEARLSQLERHLRAGDTLPPTSETG